MPLLLLLYYAIFEVPKAVTKKAKKKGKEKIQSNDINNNVADNNGNVATGNNNSNEGSMKIETTRKTKELKQDKKENKA